MISGSAKLSVWLESDLFVVISLFVCLFVVIFFIAKK